MKNKLVKILPLFTIIFIGVFLYNNFNKEKRYEKSEFLFGTYIKIIVYSKNKSLAETSISKAFDEIERIDKKFNSKSEGSLIYSLNNSDKKSFLLDDEGKELFKEIQKAYKLSNKKYDITIAPLIKLWGFTEDNLADPSKKFRLPTQEEIKKVQQKINFGSIEIKDNKLTEKNKIEIDTGSFLKGYAISKAEKILKNLGIKRGFISAVSSLVTIGTKPDNKKWRIGIQNPENPQDLLGIVSLSNESMGVSGDYQTYVEIDGKKYHHILDKDTGYPVKDKKMVVVITKSTFLADLYSTVFFLMPIDKVINFVEQKKDIEVLIVDKNMKIIKSSNFIFEKIKNK